MQLIVVPFIRYAFYYAIDFPVNDCLFLEPVHTEQDKLISFSEIILCDIIFNSFLIQKGKSQLWFLYHRLSKLGWAITPLASIIPLSLSSMTLRSLRATCVQCCQASQIFSVNKNEILLFFCMPIGWVVSGGLLSHSSARAAILKRNVEHFLLVDQVRSWYELEFCGSAADSRSAADDRAQQFLTTTSIHVDLTWSVL